MSKEKLDQFLEAVETYDGDEDEEETKDVKEEMTPTNGRFPVYLIREIGTDNYLGDGGGTDIAVYHKKSDFSRDWSRGFEPKVFFTPKDAQKFFKMLRASDAELVEFELAEKGVIGSKKKGKMK